MNNKPLLILVTAGLVFLLFLAVSPDVFASDSPGPAGQPVLPTATLVTATPYIIPTSTQLPVNTSVASPAPTLPSGSSFLVGKSYNGTDIVGRFYGSNPRVLLVVGNIHGGYEGNGMTLTGMLEEFVKSNPSVVPANLTVVFIPNFNPDGMALGTTFQGRFNGHGVDLNRNFESAWSPSAVVGTTPVNPGSGPFSEPETVAVRDLILNSRPVLTIWYHCCWGDGMTFANNQAETARSAYVQATGYGSLPGANYPVSGDAIDWQALQNLPGMEIELPEKTGRTDPDYEVNLRGFLSAIAWASAAP